MSQTYYTFSRTASHGEVSPIRFLENNQPAASTSYALEVIDTDKNRQLNGRDQYYFVNHRDHTRTELSVQAGQQLLHYLCDPRSLRARQENLQVRTYANEENDPNHLYASILGHHGLDHLNVEFSDIGRAHLFWSNSNSLDLDLLAGLRTFTRDEMSRYTNIFYSTDTSRQLLWRSLAPFAIRTGAFAAIFIAGEKTIASSFMWEMYTTNFLLSMSNGSLREGSVLRAQVDLDLEQARNTHTNFADRTNLNLRIGENRLHTAEDHLNWELTIPVVTLACLIDPKFRNFLLHPYQSFAESMNRRFLGTRTALTGNGAFAWGTALLSTLGVYGITSTWFDVMSGGLLPQESQANRFASGLSTLLTETALLARASSEVAVLTQGASGALSWANLSAIQASRVPWTALFRGIPAAIEAVEGATVVTEAAITTVNPIGLAVLAFTVGVGIGIGIDYALGIFDDDFTPTDMVREWRSWF